jgi:hypothetical protein
VNSILPGSFVALVVAPPARPFHGSACKPTRLRGRDSTQVLSRDPASPKGRPADCTARGARATRRVAYTEGE